MIFMLSIDLRKLISYTERVKDMIMEDVIEMELVAKKIFKLCCLHETSISPSLWTLCVITPVHTKKCLNYIVYMKPLFLPVYGHCVL